MTVLRSACLETRRWTGALGGDRRGGVGLELAAMLVVSVVSAMQVSALMGSALQQSFAPVTAEIAALSGG